MRTAGDEEIEKKEKERSNDDVELDNLFKELGRNFSVNAEKLLENLGLTHIIHASHEVTNENKE